MNETQFTASLLADQPPAGLSDPIRAVWHGLNDQWNEAHQIAQSREGTPAYDWVHAWLHRVEGDPGNAAYWYRRAGRPVAAGDLKSEGQAIVKALLAED